MTNGLRISFAMTALTWPIDSEATISARHMRQRCRLIRGTPRSAFAPPAPIHPTSAMAGGGEKPDGPETQGWRRRPPEHLLTPELRREQPPAVRTPRHGLRGTLPGAQMVPREDVSPNRGAEQAS